MTSSIGTSTNTNDTGATINTLVDSNISATLLPAQLTEDPPRITVWCHNAGNQALWVKFQLASVDNLKEGIKLQPDESRIIMNSSDIYTGEISGIMNAGGFRNVIITWF